MNSRERVLAAMNHREGDRVPFDMGGTVVTGIHSQGVREPAGRAGVARP